MLALASRLVIVAIAAITLAMFTPRRNPNAGRWDSDALGDHTLAGHVLRLGDRWDATWYLGIAEHGYSFDPSAAAFYPLYPALIAALGMLGMPLWLGGTLISLAALCAAAAVLNMVFCRLPGFDVVAARRGVLLWLFFPFSVVLGAIYPESLLALFLAAAWLLALQDRRLLCGIAVGLALLTKSLGVAGFAFLFLTHARKASALAMADRHQQVRPPWRGGRTWLGAAVAAALGAMWPLYLQLSLGDPLRFVGAQAAWRREPATLGPLGGAWQSLRAAISGRPGTSEGGIVEMFTETLDLNPNVIANFEAVHGLGMQNVLGVIAMVGLLTGTYWAFRWYGAGAGVACLVVALVPLMAPAAPVPLMSVPRFLLMALPLFAVLSYATRRAANPDLWSLTSAALFGMVTTGWTLWQWMG